MITFGKKGDLSAMRLAASYIRDKKVVTKLFTTIAPRYKERSGGYTRIVKLGIRPGDNAPISLIELVEEQLEQKPAKKPGKKSAATTAAAKPRVPRAKKAPETPAAEESKESIETPGQA
jgi:large subunit ribosomal protein L17